ncbi:hypothetical protein JHK82_052629 [Glycine max]|nr:hypothetical protein JHK86_052477 [Glycine max]KAG4926840.1 hypothetical protein JHK85_053326 [Glycine max]KAG5085232.1 hypothetical protein JHK82_052629 [Glycine max]
MSILAKVMLLMALVVFKIWFVQSCLCCNCFLEFSFRPHGGTHGGNRCLRVCSVSTVAIFSLHFCCVAYVLRNYRGWAFADFVLHRLAPLWVGARGLEFTWDYILQGLEANANLIFALASAQLLSISLVALGSLMWLQKNKPKTLIPIIYLSAGIVATMPSITSPIRKFKRTRRKQLDEEASCFNMEEIHEGELRARD